MAKLEDKIAAAETKLKQLKAKQQRIEARRRTLESKRSRKADTRRKILIGAVILAKIERGEFTQAQLNKWLNEALTRPDDRALFDLKAG